MKTKINLRLVGIAILAIASTVMGITIIFYNLFQDRVREDLATNAKLLKDTHYFESVKIDTDTIYLLENLSELRVTWIDESGTVLYDNDADAHILENHMDRPEIKSAFLTGTGESVRRSDTMNKDTFYYAVLLNNSTVLRVATNAQSIWSVFVSAAPLTSLIILVIIAICIVLSHMLTIQLLKPVEMMAENLENTDYSSPYKELDPIAEKMRLQHADILLAAKTRQDFTANVSHELKTPLTAISGYAELLENGMTGEDQKNHFYKEIRKNADRLLSLINDIIRLSELDRSSNGAELEEIDLFETARECMGSLEVLAKQKDIEISFDGDRVFVCANKDMIKEVVENLVQNAIRYNNPGGKVEVLVRRMSDRGALIVKDNGIGIPKSEQERIFERFYRVDKSRSKATGGTGLGLAIVKHIVDIHEGKIELDSAPGVGTTLTVLL